MAKAATFIKEQRVDLFEKRLAFFFNNYHIDQINFISGEIEAVSLQSVNYGHNTQDFYCALVLYDDSKDPNYNWTENNKLITTDDEDIQTTDSEQIVPTEDPSAG